MRRCNVCGTRVPAAAARCAAHRASPGFVPLLRTQAALQEDDEEPQWPRQHAELMELFSEGEVIGRGGFATVYRVRRVSDDREFALKVAHSRFARERHAMAREVEVLQAIGGRGAPRWIESRIGEQDKADYVMLELLGGTSLADRMANFGRILLPQARDQLISGIFDALERVHECGFVHNDLKPENVVFGPDQPVTLCDFDQALRQGEKVHDPSLSRWLGTTDYLAPERIRGNGPADLRADIYSLGVMLYEIYTGHPPFWGPEVQVRGWHQSARPPSLRRALEQQQAQQEGSPQERRFIDAIHDLVHRCLRKDPQRRPRNVAELRGAWNEAHSTGSNAQISARTNIDVSVDLGVDLAQLCEGADQSQGLHQSTVGVLWVTTQSDRAEFLLRILDAGCVLVHCDRHRYVLVSGFGALVNPVLSCLNAALRLLETPDLRLQIVADVATVHAAYEDGKPPYFLSELWRRKDRFAVPEDGRGLYIHNPAHELVPDLVIEPLNHRRYARWNRRSLLDMESLPPQVSRIVGHRALMDALALQVRSARQGRPSLQWVFGSAGRGKSFMAAALARSFSSDYPHERHVCWRVSSRASRSVPEALRELWCVLKGEPFKRVVLGEGSHRMLPLSQQHLLATILDADRPVGHDATEHRDCVEVVGAMLRGYAAGKLLVLVVDDAHLLHEAVLEGIRALCRTSSYANMIGLLFAQEDPDRSKWIDDDPERSEVAHTLEALTPRQSAQLARQRLRHVAAVPQRALDWIATRSAGNPMMIAGLVRALLNHRVVYPDPRNRRWEIDTERLDSMPQLPANEWLAEHEIGAWPPGLRHLAQWAAVLPAGFRLGEFEAMLDKIEELGGISETSLDPDYGLNRMLEAQVLYRDGDGGYYFCHAAIRLALLRQLGGQSLVDATEVQVEPAQAA